MYLCLHRQVKLPESGHVLQAIGRSRTPKAGTGSFITVDELPFFLQAEVLKPFISEELMMSTTPILFRPKNGLPFDKSEGSVKGELLLSVF